MRKTVDKDFRVVFANAFRVRVGDNDCALTFIAETDDPNGPYQVDQVQVVLTPRALKIINYGITKGLERLEAIIGPVPVPEDKLRALDAAFTVQAATPPKSKP